MAIGKSVVINSTTPTVNQQPIYYETSSELTEHVHTNDCLNDLICSRNYSVDINKTKMMFSPSAFSTTDLYSILNTDDSMSLEIRVLDLIAKIRNKPNIASACILVAKSGDEFEVTKQFKGWFYIESIKGWIESDKVLVTNVIRPYDPETEVDFDSDDVLLPESEYDAQSIINALKKSNHKLPSYTVMHTHKQSDGTTEESLLSVLLEQLINSRDLVDVLTEKVGNMPKIPSLKNEIGLTLVSEFNELSKTYKVSWKKLDFNNLSNIPELRLIGQEEF